MVSICCRIFFVDCTFIQIASKSNKCVLVRRNDLVSREFFKPLLAFRSFWLFSSPFFFILFFYLLSSRRRFLTTAFPQFTPFFLPFIWEKLCHRNVQLSFFPSRTSTHHIPVFREALSLYRPRIFFSSFPPFFISFHPLIVSHPKP